MFEATPEDPWWVDPKDLSAVLLEVQQHVLYSTECTHGKGFTYDFCPLANGIVDKALKIAKCC